MRDTKLPSPRETDADSEGGDAGFIPYLPAILWQRRWLVLIPLIFCSLSGIALALFLPRTYEAKAILLVQSQELPQDLVGSPLASIVNQRVAKIKQDVLSRGDLIQLIQQYDLYPNERQQTALSKVVEKMRTNTNIEGVSADIGNASDKTNTIAISLTYDYSDPIRAQRVVQSFVDGFLERDSVQSAKEAANTVEFLSAQSSDIQGQIKDIEGQLTQLKLQNGLALATSGFTGASAPTSYEAQIAGLGRDNAIAAQQLHNPVKDPGVAAAEAALASARAIYSESHPDVRFARQRLEEAQRLAASNPNRQAADAAAAQIAGNNMQIQALRQASAREASRSAQITSAQGKAPAVMEKASQLESRATALRTQYEAIGTKLLSAQNSAKMEDRNLGERLSVADPPVIPDTPKSPNRLALTIAGIMLGGILGFVLAIGAELVFKPIRGVDQIERLLGAAPLTVIPTLNAVSTKRVGSFLPRLGSKKKSRVQAQ
jgi:succinoglycan biosynthesis transport protein ExoP